MSEHDDTMALPSGGFADWCRRHRTGLLLAGVLLLALALRIPGLFRDLPFTYYGAESHLVKRSMAIASGDLNPHWFNKPALLMYVLAFAYGVMYLAGALFGSFDSPEQFAAWYLENPGPFIFVGRCLVCAAGIAVVYLVFRIARRMFAGDRPALAAALLAAVVGPLVFSSQQLKADVPCAAFVMLSLLVYLRSRETGSWKMFALAGLIGGLGVGTKYYAIILVPAFAIGELLVRRDAARPWKSVFLRIGLLPLLFSIGFFVASPYHFLDPTFSSKIVRSVNSWVDPSERVVQYDPDSQVEFETGPSSLIGATAHFLEKFVSPNVVGILPTLLMLLGIVAALASREHRRVALVPLVAAATFVLFAVTLSAYHTNFRHLVAVLPLLCLFAMPPSSFSARRWVAGGLLALLLVTAGYESYRTVERNRLILREDSRNRSREWILASIDPAARILLDDYGPQVPPSTESLGRMRARLAELPSREAFTAHQKRLLDIRERYPSTDAKNVDRLGHPWWLPRELTQEELLADRRNREASNPLTPRIPLSIEEYRKLGFQYIITNSSARAPYFDGSPRAKNFPTWRAFYLALDAMKPERVFDPADWGGKGPVVRVYRLNR